MSTAANDELRVERGRRRDAEDKLRRVLERTKEQRDYMAIIEQLDAEVKRLESQANDYWKGQHDAQVRNKRVIEAWKNHFWKRDKLAREAAELAWAWLQWYEQGGPEPSVPVREIRLMLDEEVTIPAAAASVVGRTPSEKETG